MDKEIKHAQDMARKALRIVIFIGMFAVLLMMINIYVLLTQITATAEITKDIHTINKQIKTLEDKIEK